MFGSVFRSAVRSGFTLAPPKVQEVCLVSDRDAEATQPALEQAQRLLSTLDASEGLRWRVLSREAWATDPATPPIRKLLSLLEAQPPDLIVTRRNLLAQASSLSWSLGAVVDTLTQATEIPVLLLPETQPSDASAEEGARQVLVVTDHLTGDDRLVNWGVHMTWQRGTLYLAHVEDDATLAHYLEVIGRLPQLDSDEAAARLPDKLLSLPRAYIASVAEVLRAHAIDETVVPIVRLGHALTDYKALIDEHALDLLIFACNDEDQRAMSGLAHALAVEIRHKPLLLL